MICYSLGCQAVLSDVSVHVNCMMIYETSLPPPIQANRYSCAKLGRAGERLILETEATLPHGPAHLQAALIGIKALNTELLGWGRACRLIRKKD